MPLSSFPKSYVESSHRHEWFEKLDRARETEEDVVADGDPVDRADAQVVLDEVVEIRLG
jgi:hypothetical protein